MEAVSSAVNRTAMSDRLKGLKLKFLLLQNSQVQDGLRAAEGEADGQDEDVRW